MISDMVTIIVPTIPERVRTFTPRAMRSVYRQDYSPIGVMMIVDGDHDGAAVTRNRGIMVTRSEWVAFVDDDDVIYPHHIRTLLEHALATGADVTYSHYLTFRNGEPCGDPLGGSAREFDAVRLRKSNYIPVTTLCRTDAVKSAGGFQSDPEDYGLWIAMLNAGATFSYVPEITWEWHFHDHQTGGRSKS